MLNLSYSIDWISYTDPGLLPHTDIFDYSWSELDAGHIVPMRGYNRAMRLKQGRIDWHTEYTSQRRLWTFTGDNLRAMRDAGYTDEQLVSDLLKTFDGKVTRLDFAIDVREGNADPADIEKAWHDKTIKTQARKMTVIQATTRKQGTGGKTVYIGSRTSQCFLRVYDKGAEQGTCEDWIRVEAELKPPLSGLVLRGMDRAGVAPAGTAAIKKFVQAPCVGWYTDALSGVGEIDLRGGRKTTDWEKWVQTVALPNVIKALELKTPGIAEALRDALNEQGSIPAS